MKKFYLFLAIALLIGVGLIIKIKLTGGNDMKYIKLLNSIDERILRNHSLEELKKKRNLDQVYGELKNHIDTYERESKDYLDQMLSFFNLTFRNSWEDFSQALNDTCTKNLGFEISSQEFTDFYQSNIVSDGITYEEKKQTPLFEAMEFYVTLNEDAHIHLDPMKSIEKAFDEYRSKNLYEFVIEPYLDTLNVDSEKTNGLTINTITVPSLKPMATGGPKSPVNGQKAQAYAEKWANGHNTYYQHLGANDCTNFVSQCLYNGELVMTFLPEQKNKSGIVQDVDHWFYIPNKSSKGYAMSTSWIRVNEIKSYLGKTCASEIKTDPEDVKKYLQAGFVLLGRKTNFFNPNPPWQHAVLVTRKNGKLCYCDHSNNRLNEPLKSFTDAFNQYWVIQTY